ncbi:MAG: glycogen debranching enzyme family protein [Holophagales bacterium]|jgi:predicted glycogen debranching enzyme|nr:glycogen debranching enzyme family protein [Holophagales bacterium]
MNGTPLLPDAEWLETNGLGGFALSTVSGRNARRYHGLLVAATTPPTGRSVLLGKLEETLVLGQERFDLSVNRYGGRLHPRGDLHLRSFRVDPFPTWEFEVGDVRLRRTFFLVHGEETAVILWELTAAPEAPVRLEVRPLLVYRGHHELRGPGTPCDPAVWREEGAVRLHPCADLPDMRLAHDAESVAETFFWYRGLEYDLDRERGFEYSEDLFSPLSFSWDLSARPEATLVATLGGRPASDAPALAAAEEKRRRRVEGAGSDRRLLRLLRSAADRFVVKRGDGWTIIAGYPWFTDWGRDAMIALPGLLLSTRRFDVARSVLETFARHVDRGMVPNRFPDEGTEPEYNNVDGTLWFVEAVRAYLEAARDENFLRQVYPLLVEIVERHLRGTRFGIRADVDGLLTSGEPGQQLTWMDAKVDGRVVTPRSGKPVEVQALWHNALRIVALYAANLGDAFTAARLLALADQARESFGALFWDEKTGHLADVVAPDGTRDLTLRPNQLFALSLHRPLLTGARAASVLKIVEERLLTPYGLRTLDPAHADYRGRFEGGPAERDAAYHQGTAWPWLLGPFVDAHLAVRGNNPESRRTASAWLAPLVEHLLGPGLGLLPEVFDGDAPHRPGGCVAQAWSVGEVLRAVLKTGA